MRQLKLSKIHVTFSKRFWACPKKVELSVTIFYSAALHKRIFTTIPHAKFGLTTTKIFTFIFRKNIQRIEVLLMICKKILIYLGIYNAKQTFANVQMFGFIYERLFSLYISYTTLPNTYLNKHFLNRKIWINYLLQHYN
jgi:hypothetical protein